MEENRWKYKITGKRSKEVNNWNYKSIIKFLRFIPKIKIVLINYLQMMSSWSITLSSETIWEAQNVQGRKQLLWSKVIL